MPHVTVTIGNRTFEVACQEGEEKYLQSAAAMLDTEASVLVSQAGRMPEAQMLLMSGLMLADKTAGLEDRVKALEARVSDAEAETEKLRNMEPRKIEVPVVPAELNDTLAELAAQAEALADEIDERASSAAS